MMIRAAKTENYRRAIVAAAIGLTINLVLGVVRLVAGAVGRSFAPTASRSSDGQ